MWKSGQNPLCLCRTNFVVGVIYVLSSALVILGKKLFFRFPKSTFIKAKQKTRD